jgi:hypothetical protein
MRTTRKRAHFDASWRERRQHGRRRRRAVAGEGSQESNDLIPGDVPSIEPLDVHLGPTERTICDYLQQEG